jgi:cysteine-rich repeat protein
MRGSRLARRAATLPRGAALACLALSLIACERDHGWPAFGGSGGAGGGAGAGGGTGGAGGGPIDTCGDGVVDVGEECDDGNDVADDGCTSNCTAAFCGDGVVQAGEACDDGNDASDDACVAGCLEATCGDGIVHVGVEPCDDGNDVPTDGCDQCVAAATGCGNGTLEAGEECDDGNASNADACVAGCKSAECGDGYAQLGVEECDDGNDVSTDSCSNACTVNLPSSFDCPGQPVLVTSASSITLAGHTGLATDASSGSCGGDGAPEVTYQVVADEDGTLLVGMIAIEGLDPVLYARTGGCEVGVEQGCADLSGAGGYEELTLPVTAGEPVSVFADGFFSSGEYLVSLDLVPSCAAVPISVGGGADVVVQGSTAGGGADLNGQGLCANSNDAPDVLYAVTPSASGELLVLAEPSGGFDVALYARGGACGAGAQLACADSEISGQSELLSVVVTAGETVHVVVDGYETSSGTYTLTFSM